MAASVAMCTLRQANAFERREENAFDGLVEQIGGRYSWVTPRVWMAWYVTIFAQKMFVELNDSEVMVIDHVWLSQPWNHLMDYYFWNMRTSRDTFWTKNTTLSFSMQIKKWSFFQLGGFLELLLVIVISILFYSQLCNDTVDGRNPANQLRLVVYPFIYRVIRISGWQSASSWISRPVLVALVAPNF